LVSGKAVVKVTDAVLGVPVKVPAVMVPALLRNPVPVNVVAMVIDPAPLVIEMPVPAVSVDATTELPVEPM
jgi:hypothetical protein